MRTAVITPIPFRSPYTVIEAVVGWKYTLWLQTFDLPDGESAQVWVRLGPAGAGTAAVVGSGLTPHECVPQAAGTHKVILVADGQIVGQSLLTVQAEPRAVLAVRNCSESYGTRGTRHDLPLGGRLKLQLPLVIRNVGAAQARNDRVTVTLAQGQAFGVFWHVGDQRWIVAPTSPGQRWILGTFDLPELPGGAESAFTVPVEVSEKGGFTLYADPRAENERKAEAVGFSAYFGVAD